MTKEKKQFDAYAVALMVEKIPQLKDIWNKFGFAPMAGKLSDMVFNKQMNNYVIQKLRKIFRENIQFDENLSVHYKFYLEDSQNKTQELDTTVFSLQIQCSGTKKKVLDSLKDMILAIELSDVKELENGKRYNIGSFNFITNSVKQ